MVIEQQSGNPLAYRIEVRLTNLALPDFDVAEGKHPSSQLPFQVRPARQIGGVLLAQLCAGAQDMARGTEIDAIRTVVEDGHPRGHQVGQQSRKQGVQLRRAAGHQQV